MEINIYLLFVTIETLYFVRTKDIFQYKKCNDEYCMYSDGKEKLRSAATTQCYLNDMYLLEVPDDKTTQLFNQFVLQHFQFEEDTFLNMEVETSKWVWTNGKAMDKQVLTVKNDIPTKRVASLQIDASGNLNLCAAKVGEEMDRWICSRSGDCPSTSVSSGDQCYFVRGMHNITFYEAMRDCSLIGATLASFDKVWNVEKMKIMLKTKAHYWIGLRKDVWGWAHSQTVMDYNKFQYGKMDASDSCIYATYELHNGYSFWFAGSCYKTLKSICMEKHSNTNSEEIKVVTIIGWVLAAIFLLAFIVLAIILIWKLRKKKSKKTTASKRNTVYPLGSNPSSRRPQNLPAVGDSESGEYIEASNYYEDTASTLDDAKYTELQN